MRNFWMLAPLILALVACGNPSQFRTKNLSLERVEAPHENRPTIEMKPSDIVRLSGQIQYQELNAEWEGEQVTLKGQFHMGNKNFGEVEMRGQREGEEIVFSAVRDDLSEKVKAKATCISGDRVCSDFFVDIVVREEDGRIKHDQFVVQKKPTNTTTSSTSTTSTTLFKKPVPASPTTTSTTTSSTTTTTQYVVADDIEGLRPGAFVGISDDEIRDLFNVENIKTKITPPSTLPSATTTSSTTTTTRSASGSANSSTSTTTTTLNPSRVREQSVGAPNSGSLMNGVDIGAAAAIEGSLFKMVWPEKALHFATTSMSNMIQKIADHVNKDVAGYQLKVGDLSLEQGGLVGHKSHQNGLDADLGYIVSNARSEYRTLLTANGGLNADFMPTENWKMIKQIFESPNVEVIFVHTEIKKSLCAEAIRVGDLKDANDRGTSFEILRRVRIEDGHHHHYHLRLACQKTDKRCRNLVGYAAVDSGCF